MSRDVSVAFTTVGQSFAPGTTFGGYQVNLGSLGQIVQASPALFSQVPAGSYAVSVQAVDSAHNPIGSAVSGGTVNVVDNVTIQVPQAGSVVATVQ